MQYLDLDGLKQLKSHIDNNYQKKENITNADTVDGFHASKDPESNTIPVNDENCMLPVKSIALKKFTKDCTLGWYRVYESVKNPVWSDNILLNISSTYYNNRNVSFSILISISYDNITFTQLSGNYYNDGNKVIDSIRVLKKHNSVYYIDIHCNITAINPISITGFGEGKFQEPVLSNDIPEGYTATEFTMVNGFRSVMYGYVLSEDSSNYAGFSVGSFKGIRLLLDNAGYENFEGITASEAGTSGKVGSICCEEYGTNPYNVVGNIVFTKNGLYYRKGLESLKKIWYDGNTDNVCVFRGTVTSIENLPAKTGIYNISSPLTWYGGAVVFNCVGSSNSGLVFYCPGGSHSIPKILTAGNGTNAWADRGTIVTTATSSDARLKENIQPLEDRGFINPVTFTKDGQEHLGFIAQDVQTKYPELVGTCDEYLTLNYIEIIPILEAQIIKLNDKVQEQQKIIDSLINRIEILEQK